MFNHRQRHQFRFHLLASAAVSSLGALPAVAQDAGTEAQSVEKVTVTGSRLKKRDYSTTSPVTTIGSQTFELTQTNSVEKLLNDLPQLVPGNTFTSNNAGGEDFATIDLRGLGANRTLVLVNGNRLPMSSTSGVADINTIPAGLIDRVEVVTGGASAVYGSDAMAGVVNFVLKKDFEGMEVTTSAGQGENGFAEERNVQALLGGNFAGGNGNITIFGEYYSREGLLQSKQGFSKTAAAICYSAGVYTVCDSADDAYAAINNGGLVTISGGSGTPPWGWITNDGANPFQNLSTLLPGQFGAADADCDPTTTGEAVDSGNLSFNDAGALTPRFARSGTTCLVPDRAAGSSRYNYAPDNYIVLPAERYNLSMFGHYDLQKNMTLNYGAIYSDSFTRVQLAPTPATGIEVNYNPTLQSYIQANHPDLYQALQSRDDPTADFVLDRRTSELGTRNGKQENSSLNLFASLEGAFGENWNYELSGSFADVDFVEKLENSANKTALIQGLAGCRGPRQAGLDGILGTADDTDSPLGGAALPGCVQVDLFGANYGNSPLDHDAMTEFLRVNTWSRTQVEETVVSGFVSGDMFNLTGAGAISTVAGVEYRSTKASFEVDNEQRTGNIYGFNALQDQAGTIDVYEAYSEISVPLIKDKPFVYDLTAEAGYRISDYNIAGTTHTYKYGGNYAPFEWLKFRGIYNKATRAPSVFEAFQNGDQGFPSYTDPCRDVGGDGQPDVPGVSLSECTAAGVPLAQYPGFIANNSQVEAFSFGNHALSPETAETTTYGFVLQTGNDWFGIGNLRASVDSYDIKIADVILDLSAQYYINTCYTGTDAVLVAEACARVVRDPTTGQIDHVNTFRSNQGELATNGIDIQVDYRLNLADIGLGGVLTINELYSIIDSYQINGDELAGTTSAAIGTAIFDWKSVLSGSYAIDDWMLYSRWSYVPELPEVGFGTISGFAGTTPIAPEASYVDVALRYTPVDWLAVTVTVNNVSDEETPQTINGVFSQANTDPQVYDVVGRSWFLSVKTKM
ncbi:MAG: TonB-dependent receptor [Micropepsaceae bacterium]